MHIIISLFDDKLEILDLERSLIQAREKQIQYAANYICDNVGKNNFVNTLDCDNTNYDGYILEYDVDNRNRIYVYFQTTGWLGSKTLVGFYEICHYGDVQQPIIKTPINIQSQPVINKSSGNYDRLLQELIEKVPEIN